MFTPKSYAQGQNELASCLGENDDDLPLSLLLFDNRSQQSDMI